MVVTRLSLAVLVLQVVLILQTDALGENETTDDLALQILLVSSTAVSVQWNCRNTDNLTLEWNAMVKNAVEKWERKDKKLFEPCQNASNTVEQFTTTITDLEEGVKYQVSAIQFEVTLSSKNFETQTSVPSGPPIYLRAHSVNPAGLHITWGRPKLLNCNGDILQYVIMVDSGSDVQKYTSNVTSECISRTCTNIECMSHHFTISELVPHKNHSVRVAAVNINGTGPFSDAIGVMTGDDEPGSPENLRVISSGDGSDEFTLQWDMPRNPNGVILRYKVEYGITNDSMNASNYTDSTNYTLHLLTNETYTITVYAENSVGLGRASQIQWSLSDDRSSSDTDFEVYKYIIIGSCVGAFILILFVCTCILYIRSRRKKSSSSRSKSSQFHPAEVTTVVNLGYIYAERGSNSLPYDYPYIEANGAQASSTTTFQTQRSTKSTNRNSTSTCGYIEMSSVLNGNPTPHPASHSVPNSPHNISEHTSIASSSNSNNCQYINTNCVPAGKNNMRVPLSPPAHGVRVNIKANTQSDNGYVTLHS